MAEARGLLGSGLAVGALTAVVGAPGDSLRGPSAGSIHVFVRNAVTGTYSMTQTIQPPGLRPFDRFGAAMALGGNVLVVGAKGDDTVAPNAGAAYVFRRFGTGNPFQFVAKLTAPGAGANDGFGAAVSVLGDQIAIGAPQADDTAFDAGAVYTYTFDLGLNQVFPGAMLLNPSGAAGDGYGFSLATAPGFLAVGAERLDAPGGTANSGGVILYERAGATWVPTQTLFQPTPSAYARFGAAMALVPPRPGTPGSLVVGAPDASAPPASTKKGAVTVFQAALGGPWTPVFSHGLLLAGSNNELGASVAIFNDTIFAGAPGRGDSTNMIYDRGGVDVLQRAPSGAWSYRSTVELPDAATAWRVGDAVAIQDGFPLVGAPGANEDGGLRYEGAAWSVPHSWAGVGDIICHPPVPNSTGFGASLVARGSIFAAARDLTLEGGFLPTSSVAFALVSSESGFTAQPGGSQGNLCLDGQIGRMLSVVRQAGADGRVTMPVDLLALPQPTGPVTVQPGQAWWFQLWYRDTSPTGPVSNFTDALRVGFR